MHWDVAKLSTLLDSFLHDADLGCPQDAITDLKARRDNNLYSIISLFRYWDGKNCLMQSRVELLALRVILNDLESFETFVHHIGCHLLALHRGNEFVLYALNILVRNHSLDVGVLNSQSDGITHLKQVFCELRYRKFLLILNHLAIAQYSLLVLFNLLCELDTSNECLFFLTLAVSLVLFILAFKLLDLLLEGLNLRLLLGEKLLYTLDVLSRQTIICLSAFFGTLICGVFALSSSFVFAGFFTRLCLCLFSGSLIRGGLLLFLWLLL